MKPEPQGHVRELVEHLFRHQAGQMLAALTHVFGLENLDLAEEVVQEALVQALRQWPFHGTPDNPRAWLLQTARNKALDLLRRRASLYLLFNEGYAAHSGENLVREELCGEAVRLAELLLARPSTALPKVHALLALFYFQAARLATRVDGQGNLLLLAEQERKEWDKNLVERGLSHLDNAAKGDELTEYHLQAAIAAVHATSSSFVETDWPYLLRLYDQLLVLSPSPVVMLNRAIALSMVDGPRTALQSLEELTADPAMKSYYLLPAVQADLLRRLGRANEAAAAYRQAMTCLCTEPERRFLERRLRELGEPHP